MGITFFFQNVYKYVVFCHLDNNEEHLKFRLQKRYLTFKVAS